MGSRGVETRNPTVSSIAVRRYPTKVTVVIRGYGLRRYQILSVNALALALDFPSAVSTLRFRILPVGHVLLKEIRIIPVPQKLRILCQLTTRARYALKETVKGVAIQFKA